MVALTLLGQATVPATRTEDLLDSRARLLVATLSGVPHQAGTQSELAASVRRLQHGRLLTALG